MTPREVVAGGVRDDRRTRGARPRLWWALLPYLAVLLGLYVGRSAWWTFALYHIGVLVLVGRSKLWRRLITGWAAAPALGLVAFGLGGGALLWLLAPQAEVDAARIAPLLARFGLQGPAWLAFVLYHSLVNPWFEELFWRGALGSDSPRPVAADLLFAGYHVLVLAYFLAWPWVLLSFGLLVLAAWLWRQMARRFGGLLVPALSHLAADAGVMLVVYGKTGG